MRLSPQRPDSRSRPRCRPDRQAPCSLPPPRSWRSWHWRFAPASLSGTPRDTSHSPLPLRLPARWFGGSPRPSPLRFPGSRRFLPLLGVITRLGFPEMEQAAEHVPPAHQVGFVKLNEPRQSRLNAGHIDDGASSETANPGDGKPDAVRGELHRVLVPRFERRRFFLRELLRLEVDHPFARMKVYLPAVSERMRKRLLRDPALFPAVGMDDLRRSFGVRPVIRAGGLSLEMPLHSRMDGSSPLSRQPPALLGIPHHPLAERLVRFTV